MIGVDPSLDLCQNSRGEAADLMRESRDEPAALARQAIGSAGRDGSSAGATASRKFRGCRRLLLQDEDSVMGEVRPQSGTIRDGLIPHRWTRVEDPGSVAVVAAYEAIIA